MPKAYSRRTHRPVTYRRRSRSTLKRRILKLRKRFLKLTIVHMLVVLILVGFLTIWVTQAYNVYNNTSAPFSQLQSAQEYTVAGEPTISADFINQVLDYYHSPAAGKGQALYDYGVQYHIDPVFALAFFMHESTFGKKGVATVTYSLGNIRAKPGEPQYHGYRLYNTWEEGFEAWYRLIANQYVDKWGLYTVEQIIPVYAPSSDNNNVDAYIQAVEKAVDTWRSGTVQVESD